MNVLPRFIFIFLHLNLAISKLIINAIQSVIKRFIWKAKPPKLKVMVIQQRIKEGRLAVQNILNYYRAAQLVALAQWWSKGGNCSNCCGFEQEGIEVSLSECILLNKAERQKYQKGQSIIRKVLVKNWDEARGAVAPGLFPIASF